MVKRITLPRVIIQKDAKAHPFPFQVALQTEEFMQGAVFYFICADEAAGKFVRLPDGINTLKAGLLKAGMQEQEWESGWKLLSKYRGVFESIVFRNVLVTIRSYWDWYMNKLVEFVIFAQNNTGNAMTEREVKRLLSITYKEITEQITMIENICELDFKISEETKQYIQEMSLVRNLGLHNRWEVDQHYLEKTAEKNKWQIGDIRDFDSKELRQWHTSLIDLIGKTCGPIAIKYLSAPAYPPEANRTKQ
jgi:hypothetical protein